MVSAELDNVVLKALARDRNNRFANAAEMADALDDVVHASRFQPGHLAQLLHDLFPLEGGGGGGTIERRVPTHTSTNLSAVTGTGSGVPSAIRSPTIQPIARSVPVTGTVDPFAAPVVLQKSRSGAKVAATAALVLAVGGFVLWKGMLAKRFDQPVSHAASFDPSRRFNIYVKSEPSGADIFLDGNPRPVGATPISLPIDLNGVSSVKMVLKKPGFEDYQQIITTDSPVSINLQPSEGAEGAHPAAPASAAPSPTPPPAAGDGTDDSSGDRGAGRGKHRGTGKRAGHGKGSEIVDPF
jgi:hypothetical protein